MCTDILDVTYFSDIALQFSPAHIALAAITLVQRRKGSSDLYVSIAFSEEPQFSLLMERIELCIVQIVNTENLVAKAGNEIVFPPDLVSKLAYVKKLQNDLRILSYDRLN